MKTTGFDISQKMIFGRKLFATFILWKYREAYSMYYKMLSRLKYFLFFAILAALVFGFFYARVERNKREQNARYTIGVVLEKFTSKSGTYLKTSYCVDNVEYIKNFNSFGDRDAVGKRYFIKFEKGNPENAELISKYIANSNAIAPDSGWVKIPGIPDDQ